MILLIILMIIVSFFAGFGTYVFLLDSIWDQSLGGEFGFILICSMFAYFIIAVPLYYLAIYIVDRFNLKNKLVYYPLACMLMFFLPTMFVFLIFVGAVEVFSAESALFYGFFAASGFTFGIFQYFISKFKKSKKVSDVSSS